jgi:PAS domain S-box-containing protein
VKALKAQTLRTKLRIVIMVTTGVALLLESGAFVVFDYVSFRDAATRRLQVLADVVANQSTGAIDSGDRRNGEEILAKLSVQREILSAAIYGPGGALFAEYSRETPKASRLPGPAAADGFRSDRGDMILTQPIVRGPRRIGTVSLRFDLREATERVWTNAAISGAVLLLAAMIALALSGQLERLVTGPITNLADMVRRVTTHRDYSIRAEKLVQDELGVLIDGLNDMLSQIQVRDGALQMARNELELRVEERTAQLTYVNEELQNEVSERKRVEEFMRESEERYRQLVELSPDAIVIHHEGKYAYVNSAAVKLFGAGSPSDLIGMPVLDRVAPEYREDTAQRIQAVYEGRRVVSVNEEKFLRLDGSAVEVEISAIPFTFQGRPAAQVIIRDITQRKEVERMKNEFVSTVSHELRTPLTSIQGSLGLIANGVTGVLPPAARPLVEIAHKNCQRLILLINDLLDMEKIAAGKMKFSLKPQDLLPLVEHSIEANRSFGAQFGVKFILDSRAPDARVNVDADRIIQVLTNLLSNASKFSPPDGTVTITVRRAAQGVRVEVADRGAGIPEEFRSRIFQKFSQADSSDMRQKGGTGLGLSISRTIIEKHRGTIGFESETGRGTSFFILLPEYRETPTSPPTPAVPAAAPSAPAPRILVCEDDPQIAQLIRTILAKDGFESDVAEDAASALSMLKEREYRAMTLDLMLPDKDGVSLLGELRSQDRTRNLPVIVVSAVSPQARRELCGGALSVVDCLDKPIDQQRLLGAARLAMNGKSSRSARILHVEPDEDIRKLVAYTLRTVAETTGAATFAEAQTKLESDPFDLVILDVELPDRSGLELVPFINRPDRPRVPVVFFSAQKGPNGSTQMLAAALVKSLASEEALPLSVKSWLQPGASSARPEGPVP